MQDQQELRALTVPRAVANHISDEFMARLVAHGQADEATLRRWLEKRRQGLLPYAGAWRTREEIVSLRRRIGRRSQVILAELIGLLSLILALDIFLFVLLQRMFAS